MSENSVEVVVVKGAEIEPYVEALAKLRIEVFREYPYLYDGSMEYERGYLRAYAKSQGSLFVIARDGGEVVGVSTALPLSDAEEAFRKPFVERGDDAGAVYYFGESVLRRDYRGRGLGGRFMREREAFARERRAFRWCAFCAVERASDDPRRPEGYRPLDAFWNRCGFRRDPTLRASFEWKEVGSGEPSVNTMVFWLKRL